MSNVNVRRRRTRTQTDSKSKSKGVTRDDGSTKAQNKSTEQAALTERARTETTPTGFTTLTNSKARGPWRTMFIEVFAAMLWTTVLLTLFISTRLSLIHVPSDLYNMKKMLASTPLPLASMTPLPFTLPVILTDDNAFMSMVVVAMLVWDVLGLSLGSNLNPALTLASAISTWPRLLPGHSNSQSQSQSQSQFQSQFEYLALKLVCQCIGTVLAVFTVDTLFSFDVRARAVLAPPSPHAAVHWAVAVVFEALSTAMMGLVTLSLPRLFCATSKDLTHRRTLRVKADQFIKWLTATLTFLAAVAAASDWSGACMNPALALGLALLHNKWASQHVYWIGPVLGGVIAAMFHCFVIERLFPLEQLDIEQEKRDVNYDESKSEMVKKKSE